MEIILYHIGTEAVYSGDLGMARPDRDGYRVLVDAGEQGTEVCRGQQKEITGGASGWSGSHYPVSAWRT